MTATGVALKKAPEPLSSLLLILRLLRVRQWVKNGLVLMPLMFSLKFRIWSSVRSEFLAALAFCFISSAAYIFNDVCDRELDRAHPLKRLRPLAGGQIGIAAAVVALLACLAAAIALGSLLPWDCLKALAVYAAAGVVYSLFARRLPVADVLMIGLLFVLRVIAGSEAIGVKSSHWILLCTFLLATFLAVTKRRAELVLLMENGRQHRSALTGYSVGLADHMSSVLLAATIVAYCLYTVAPETVAQFHTDHLLFTVPFVIFGLFRYLQLSMSNHERLGDPAETLLSDAPMLISAVLWLAACAVVLYQAGHPA
jgi:4-hydroxybenzoate polyprenyltransferase